MDEEIPTYSEDEVDEELVALANTEPPSVLRLILIIGVLFAAPWILTDWVPEIEYFFSESQPLDLGDSLDFATTDAASGAAPEIPHNRYVKIQGIPVRRSISARYRYSILAGGWIFVETQREDWDDDPFEKELNGGEKADIDRTLFQGAGRAIAFNQMPDRYRGLKEYYRSRYGVNFCEDLTEKQRVEINQTRHDSIISQWQIEYEEATPEKRAKDGLTEKPSEAEVAQILENNPVCVNAVLIQGDVKPRDHWKYIGFALIFLGFMAVNLYMLFRWVRSFTRA